MTGQSRRASGSPTTGGRRARWSRRARGRRPHRPRGRGDAPRVDDAAPPRGPGDASPPGRAGPTPGRALLVAPAERARGRTFEHAAVRGEPGSVRRAVPALLGVVPAPPRWVQMPTTAHVVPSEVVARPVGSGTDLPTRPVPSRGRDGTEEAAALATPAARRDRHAEVDLGHGGSPRRARDPATERAGPRGLGAQDLSRDRPGRRHRWSCPTSRSRWRRTRPRPRGSARRTGCRRGWRSPARTTGGAPSRPGSTPPSRRAADRGARARSGCAPPCDRCRRRAAGCRRRRARPGRTGCRSRRRGTSPPGPRRPSRTPGRRALRFELGPVEPAVEHGGPGRQDDVLAAEPGAVVEPGLGRLAVRRGDQTAVLVHRPAVRAQLGDEGVQHVHGVELRLVGQHRPAVRRERGAEDPPASSRRARAAAPRRARRTVVTSSGSAA